MMGRIRRRHAVVLWVCALLAVSRGVGAADFTAVEGQEYRELNEQPTQVSGLSVVGVSLIPGTATEGSGKALPDKVFARAVKAFSGSLRVDLASADGLFRGEGVFQGEAKEGEWIGLSLVPKVVSGKRAGRTDMNRSTVAVLVRRLSGEQAVGPPLVASWDNPPNDVSGHFLRLYVNSRRAAEMRVRVGSKVVTCERTVHASGVRFDALCDLPISQIPAERKVTLIRSDGFDESSQSFTLSW